MWQMGQAVRSSALAVAMLVLGIIAGTCIPAGKLWLDERRPENAPAVLPQPPSSPPRNDLPRQLRSASLSNPGINEETQPATDSNRSPDHTPDLSPSSKDLEAASRLIRSIFPDADDTTVSVWAETFAGMSATEIRDILEQKRTFSGSLDSIFTPGLRTAAEVLPSPAPPAPVQQQPAISAARDDERRTSALNLRNAWTVGYRRRLILPAVQPTAPGSEPATPLDFIDFSSGRCLKSPYPLHAAIVGHPLQMFLLEGNLITRRGDFTRLGDGRIGLRTAAGDKALAGSLPSVNPLPETVQLRILEHGELQCLSEDGSWIGCGRADIVEVLRPEQLKTADGVLFETDQPDSVWRLLPGGASYLQSRCLEISNVDPSEELLRLQALERP
jgi:hypothetical protein